MIGYITGKVDFIENDFIIIENNGIGYNINVNQKTISKININPNNIKIFTYMHVKEDELALFGFLGLDEINLFKKLITVSGVGPKGALSLLNALEINELTLAIISSDIKKLSSGQGIGKKIAQRIAMELKDSIESNFPKQTTITQIENKELDEAIDALISLGFTKPEIMSKINGEDFKNLNSSQIISLLLKKLSK